MTTPRIEEMVEEFNDMLARNWGEKSSIYEVLSTGREKDWLRQALTQAHQAGVEEAVTCVMDEMLEYTHLGEQFIDGVRTLIEAREIKLSANHSELDQGKKDV